MTIVIATCPRCRTEEEMADSAAIGTEPKVLVLVLCSECRSKQRSIVRALLSEPAAALRGEREKSWLRQRFPRAAKPMASLQVRLSSGKCFFTQRSSRPPPSSTPGHRA